MKRYPLDQVYEALRFLRSRGWPLGVIRTAARDAGLSIVELANRIKGIDA